MIGNAVINPKKFAIMKTKYFFQHTTKATIAFLFASMTAIAFCSCSDDDDFDAYTETTDSLLTRGMLGASADTYNINDDKGTFTTENWRDQEAIFIYDGKGKDYLDADGRKGYSLVALPRQEEPWRQLEAVRPQRHGRRFSLRPA